MCMCAACVCVANDFDLITQFMRCDVKIEWIYLHVNPYHTYCNGMRQRIETTIPGWTFHINCVETYLTQPFAFMRYFCIVCHWLCKSELGFIEIRKYRCSRWSMESFRSVFDDDNESCVWILAYCRFALNLVYDHSCGSLASSQFSSDCMH